VLRHEGDVWCIAYRGRTVRVRHRKGFEYLAELLRAPEQEFAAVDLAIGSRAAQGVAARPGTTADGLGPALDRTAGEQYRLRCEALTSEIADAERMNDPLRTSRLREERRLLAQHLAAAVGLGGKRRVAGSVSERARTTVTKGIRGAIRTIDGFDPALGRYVRTHVRTGYLCSYVPDLRHAVVFHV
jgi:hypothetical protein